MFTKIKNFFALQDSKKIHQELNREIAYRRSINMIMTLDVIENYLIDDILTTTGLLYRKSDEYIKTQAQAYILDKAASMGADLTAEVILADSKPCVPSCVILSGAASPYVKRQLTETLAQQLAISEDNVVWN